MSNLRFKVRLFGLVVPNLPLALMKNFRTTYVYLPCSRIASRQFVSSLKTSDVWRHRQWFLPCFERKKLRLHFCSLSSKSIRAAFLPPRTSESNFLAAKTCYGGASIGGAVIPLASDVPLPSVVGRPGAFGTGLLGISTVSEPPHPLTAKSGIASSPTIKSGLIVFRMNLVQSVGKKNIQCQGNLATTYGSEAICQDPDSSARAAPATQSSHHAPP